MTSLCNGRIQINTKVFRTVYLFNTGVLNFDIQNIIVPTEFYFDPKLTFLTLSVNLLLSNQSETLASSSLRILFI